MNTPDDEAYEAYCKKHDAALLQSQMTTPDLPPLPPLPPPFVPLYGDERRKWADQMRAYAAAEREAMCAAIKAADDKASESDYMLDSDDCISVIRGTWKGTT